MNLRLALVTALCLWSACCVAAEEAAAPVIPDPLPGETRRPEPEGRPPLQMGTDFGLTSPTPAISNYRPFGAVESRGIKISPFTIRSAVIAGMGYDDNVTLSQANKVGSMLYTLTPSVSVGLEGAFHRYHAIYRGNYGYYASSSEDNYDDHNLSLSASDEWTTRFRSLLRYDFVRGHNQRGSTLAATTAQDRWDWHSLRGSTSYGTAGAPGGLEGRVGYSTRRYRTSPLGGVEVRDYDEFELAGAFSYRLAPKTRGLLEVQRSDFIYDRDITRDSVEMRYFAGVTWQALAKTVGSLKIGYTNRQFSSGLRSDYAAPTYEIGVTWLPRTYSVVALTARKFFNETGEIVNPFTVVTLGALNWNHSWSERTTMVLSYTVTKQDYRGGRGETFHNASIGASYALRRWLRIGAEWRHDVRDTNVPGLDYTRNLTILTLESAL